MKNKIFNSVVVVLSAFVFLSFFIFTNGLNNLGKQLRTLNIYWIVTAVLCIIIYWTFETVILYIITKTLYPSGHLLVKSLKVAMLGQFFSAVTPFQSGGQPAQLYSMSKNGIPVGFSGSILVTKFIIHQVTLTIYLIIVLFFKFSYFSSKINHFLYFCIFGFIINAIIILFTILFTVNSKTTNDILSLVLKFLKKIKIIKNLEFTHEKLEMELISFHENSAFIAKHIGMCIFTSILTFIQWTSYYAIPYCIYRSFGFNYADIWTMIAAQVFLKMFMSFIPLPGAAIGAEGGFYMIFGIFFSISSIVPAIFLWRIITYYSCIAVGSIFTLILPDEKYNGNDT